MTTILIFSIPSITTTPAPDERWCTRYWVENDSSPGIMTNEEIKDLVGWTVKEQKGWVMPHLLDKALHPFALKILMVTVPHHVQTPWIVNCNGEGDPVDHIQRQDSLLGRTNDNNNFAMIFPLL